MVNTAAILPTILYPFYSRSSMSPSVSSFLYSSFPTSAEVPFQTDSKSIQWLFSNPIAFSMNRSQLHSQTAMVLSEDKSSTKASLLAYSTISILLHWVDQRVYFDHQLSSLQSWTAATCASITAQLIKHDTQPKLASTIRISNGKVHRHWYLPSLD